MPTTQVWNGVAADGNVATAGNYVSGVAPIAGDSVLANIAPTSAMTNGTFPALVDITITDAYGANVVGALGAPITFGNVTGTMRIGSRSPFVSVTTSGTVASAKFECSVNNQVYIAGGTWTSVITGTALTLNVAATAIVTAGKDPGGAKWLVATSGTAITTWTGVGSITLTSRNITTCNADGATITLQGTAIIATTGNIVGGVVAHQSSGTLAGISLRKGSKLTVLGNPNATAQGGTIEIYTGSLVVDVVPGCTLTYTASPTGPSTPGSGYAP